MGRRSRSDESPVSMLAFQDIMVAVLGIMLFVTLIMALELTRAVEAVASPNPPDPIPDRTAELEDLRRREKQLREQYEEALKRVSGLAQLSGDKSADLASARARLEEAQREAESLEAQMEEAKTRLESAEAKERQAKVERGKELSERAKSLRTEIEERAKDPRLNYIIQGGLSKRPLLLEVSGTAVGIGSPDDRELSIWLTADTASSRLSQIRSFAQARDKNQEYFVILLKPSAFGGEYEKIVQTLRNQGFDVGTELITEDAVVVSPLN